MEHIRQYDWYASTPDIYFVEECDLDNCVTEKILRNKFYDPLVSTDSENEAPNTINWDDLFKEAKEIQTKVRHTFVPGLRPAPVYPKVSSLTVQQHNQCLKVLCASNPHILETEFLPRPTKQDHRVFEEVKEKYTIEQKEYIEWAKTQWANQCVRALRPKPTVETVYEAEFKVRAQRLQAYPKKFDMAAQIPLETTGSQCELVHVEDLITVNVSELPQLQLPEMIVKKFNIVRPLPMAEPCNKHPCRFVLPKESEVSVLPLTELHRELAQFAAEHGARCVASERALRCLAERGRRWSLPLSVCQSVGADGDRVPVVVLASEFAVQREAAPTRTCRALRHLLEYALVPPIERLKLQERGSVSTKTAASPAASNSRNDTTSTGIDDAPADSSDDEDNNLFIDTEEMNEKQLDNESQVEENQKEIDDDDLNGERSKNEEENKRVKINTSRDLSDEQVPGIIDDIGVYTCTCTDTAKPAPRSYRKWRVKNKTSNESYDIIVHCSHKVRDMSGEVLLEPIPEYQLDLGGSLQPEDKLDSIALSLLLRRNASLLNVRVDGSSGDVVTCERAPGGPSAEALARAAGAVGSALEQLQGLLPGHYVLHHEPSHGANALLYAPGPSGELQLQFDLAAPPDADEAATVKAPPTLTPVLLPYHKYRRVLPCAFSPHAPPRTARARAPQTRTRAPPQALRWPKKKQKRKKKTAAN